MKKSPDSSKKQIKDKIKKDDLKNISGGSQEGKLTRYNWVPMKPRKPS